MLTAAQRTDALNAFTTYFVKNYPGPNTVIHAPLWHSPRIFSAALRAVEEVLQNIGKPTSLAQATEIAKRFAKMYRLGRGRDYAHLNCCPRARRSEMPVVRFARNPNVTR
jgi:hypothetical protein